jgi:hypothetical protein
MVSTILPGTRCWGNLRTHPPVLVAPRCRRGAGGQRAWLSPGFACLVLERGLSAFSIHPPFLARPQLLTRTAGGVRMGREPVAPNTA